MLRDYDLAALAVETSGTAREFEKLTGELDKLEKQAVGADSLLSVLKRRRNLARLYPACAPAYHHAVRRAAEAYPWSGPIAALAAAALVKGAAITREAEAELRSYIPLFADPVFSPLRLSLHVLLGDFSAPENSVLLSGLSAAGLQGSGNTQAVYAQTEAVTLDLAIAKLLEGNLQGASAEIQAVLQGYSNSRNFGGFVPSADFLRFAAEYHYDFGDMLAAAELFSQIPGEAALLRQADSLWLAGFTDSARTFWSLLAMPGAQEPDARSLYNLAVTAQDQEEAFVLLEQLAAYTNENIQRRKDFSDTDAALIDSLQFGLIRYSRLLEASRAIAVLESLSPLKPSGYPFIDLEIQKRRAETGELGRLTAETWLLLDRHPETEALYCWAAWFFNFQRNYNEAAILYKRSVQYGFPGQWLPLYEAVQLMREGSLDSAGDILKQMPVRDADWPVMANLGRIYESELSFARALECYERAAAKVQNPIAASRIQFRIAKCFVALGRSGEIRRVLEYALDLDPENINARLELDRMESR
ncbi:MAG: hypothetical protein LBU85_05265 [Treponema sp.]|nr:hypothetical protein [Treponema sp.]